MKKVLTLICLLFITAGVASAHPFAPQNQHKAVPMPQKVAPPPKPIPVVHQPIPVATGYYGYATPSVTFSVGNVDVTLGL